MRRPKVLLIGGMGQNVPDELKTAVDIVKHIEQGTRKLADLPAVEFILVMSEFVSHNVVETVKNQASAPIVYLRKGWASMKEELTRRCILPPNPSAGEEAAIAVMNPGTGTFCGLTEAEIWDKYGQKFMDAIRDTLRPRELVSESDLLEVLSLAGGVPPADCALILHELATPGVIVSPKPGYWVSRLGSDGFDDWEGTDLPTPPAAKKTGNAIVARNAKRTEDVNGRATLLRGLPRGPYASKQAIIREMLRYTEWSEYKDSYGKFQPLLRLINRAIELKYIDDTTKNFIIDYDEKIGLRQVLPPEPTPLPAPPELLPQAEPAPVQSMAERTRIERRWPELVNAVKKQKKHIGTILEGCRFHWLAAEGMVAVIMVPNEFSMYWQQLNATENWGLVSKLAREYLDKNVALRYLMANGT